MAKKKDNLKLMKKSELEKELATLEENARVVRFKAEGSRSKNVKELSAIKRNIARVLTELRKQK